MLIDDTFMIQHQLVKEEFLKDITLVNPPMQFTVEEMRPGGSMPFLDTIITPQADGTFSMEVYRKSTYNDLYLQWRVIII